MKISVVIPVGDREIYRACRETLVRSITNVPKNSCEWEIVEVFDDERKGVAWARNEGICRASGDYVAWIDCDDAVTDRWAAAITFELLKANKESPLDVLVFNARAEWMDGRSGYDLLYNRSPGDIPSGSFARDVIGAVSMGGWLWNKVFRRDLFVGRKFVGNAFQDYRMLCEILPIAERVRYLPESLYVYRRSRTGISQYVNRTASYEALLGLIELADRRQDEYAAVMRRGLAVQIADFCRHAGGEAVLRKFLRRQVWNIFLSCEISFRCKVKCLLETFKF